MYVTVDIDCFKWQPRLVENVQKRAEHAERFKCYISIQYIERYINAYTASMGSFKINTSSQNPTGRRKKTDYHGF